MQFLSTIIVAAMALANLATALNFVHFINQDAVTTKNIVFTASAGQALVDTVVLGPSDSYTQTFPDGWIGNFYSYNEGAANVPGMLGEVAFNGFNGATFYDVSSIVNKQDNEGIKILYPFSAYASLRLTDLATSPVVSGCQYSGCTNQYNDPDDVATLSTQGTGLVCLVGNLRSNSKRRAGDVFSHEYVM